MTYKGHIVNGAIVLDEPAKLREGARVQIELLDGAEERPTRTPLRGTPYSYDSPFAPAVNAEDWEAAR